MPIAGGEGHPREPPGHPTIAVAVLPGLRRTSAGWALVSATGQTVFSPVDPDARRRCLRRAVELGAVRVTSPGPARA